MDKQKREIQREIRREKMMKDIEKYNEDNKEFFDAVKYIEDTAVYKVKTVYLDRLYERTNEQLHEEISAGFGFEGYDLEGYNGNYTGFSWCFSTRLDTGVTVKTEVIGNKDNISSHISEKIIHTLDIDVENKLKEFGLTLKDVFIEITNIWMRDSGQEGVELHLVFSATISVTFRGDVYKDK